jgi:glyoxylase-like metal-dependent hydrolase (beta-lactamase superfamily II)
MKKLIVIFLLFPLFSIAQTETPVEIGVTELAPGIHRLMVRNAVSVVVAHGQDGTLVIDAGYQQTTDRLMEEIQKLSDTPIRYLINTHLHGDHTGGNQVIGKNVPVIAHKSVREYLSKEQRRGENVTPAFPEFARPEILVENDLNLVMNGETISITHLPGGHTEGDLLVYFPDSKVLVVGDLLFAGFFPYVDTSNGGNPFKYLENVSYIIDNYPSDVVINGGHGPVFNMDELKQWHTTLSETFMLVKEAKASGMSLESMKEHRILQRYEAMGGFFITEDRWLETLYPFL